MITLEDAIELARPWARKVIEDKILPFLFQKGHSFYEKEKTFFKLNHQMGDFLAKTRAQCSTINSLAFPNTLKKVKDIYEPLTLSTLDSRDVSEYTIQRGDLFLKELNNVLIIDNAGMGKSTLLKKIVMDMIDHSEFIPIYIELRTLADQPVAEHINKLIGLDEVYSKGFLQELPFVFFFDGVDEIPFDIKNNVIKRIKEFSDDFSTSQIIITSRPDQSLLELKAYSRFKIKPLDINQSYNFIRLYDANSIKIGNSLILSSKLISEIKTMKEKDNSAILEFLTTPLFVSLLFCSYRFKPVIPRRKDLFYSQVFEALFETHDLSKETGYIRKKQSGLDITEFSIILRRLAFWCLKNNGKLEFGRSEFESILTEVISKIDGVNVKPVLFINDLIYSVPLFIKEGAMYRWAHKSLMEYFCAEFICVEVKEKRDDLLLIIYESNNAVKFKNIIELCADIDYASFRKSVLNKCLKEYIEHCKKINNLESLSELDKEIWSSISFFSDLKLLLTPYSNASLDDFLISEEGFTNDNLFENNFIGFRDFITHISFPVTLKTTVFEILRLKNPECFFREKHYFNRMLSESLNLPENIIVSSKDGILVDYNCEIIPDIINILLEFRHTLSIPVIHIPSAVKILNDITSDASNGINELLDGFD